LNKIEYKIGKKMMFTNLPKGLDLLHPYSDLSIRLSVFGHNFAAYGPHY